MLSRFSQQGPTTPLTQCVRAALQNLSYASSNNEVETEVTLRGRACRVSFQFILSLQIFRFLQAVCSNQKKQAHASKTYKCVTFLLQSDHEHERKAASESASFFADGVIATANHAKEVGYLLAKEPQRFDYRPLQSL